MEEHTAMKKNKKGITPLMATFLLITFAVALGVVVMNFGRAQVVEEAECPLEIGLEFSIIGGEEQLCYDRAAQRLRFTVENGINVNVEGLIINVIGTEQAQTYELDEAKMSRAGTYVGNAAFAAGQIRQVKITPKVILVDEVQICPEKSLVAESVPDC